MDSYQIDLVQTDLRSMFISGVGRPVSGGIHYIMVDR